VRIRISKNWGERYIQKQPGNTWAEKITHADRALNGACVKWGKGMEQSAGKWVEVETKYLFDDQFNVAEPNLRVDFQMIDAINFGPEFEGIDEWEAAVQERYDKDWPGSKLEYHVIRSHIKNGFITVWREDAREMKTTIIEEIQ